MRSVVVDFETYYGDSYTLSKMTTEAYIRDPRFEVILCGFKEGSEPGYWVDGPDVGKELQRLKLQDCAVIAHHAHFDGLILSHRYNVRPKRWIDTLSMARAIHGTKGGNSLAKLAERHGLGAKGHEVVLAKDKRRANFDPSELRAYGQYCVNDCELEYDLALQLTPHFQRGELNLIDSFIRMFTEPVLRVRTEVLQQYIADLRANMAALLTLSGTSLEDLRSANKFAAALQLLGVDPPLKISKTTGKWTYAFSKSDPEMQELAEHEDPAVQALVAARLGAKSTLNETRALRLIDMAGRGPACVYLNYYGAGVTGRASGGDKMNWQNNTRGSPLRKAVYAPIGMTCVVGDSSNIESRLEDWLAGQDDVVEAYRRYDAGLGPDIYCVVAERIYGRPITKKENPDERQMGKTCLAADTAVLTDKGVKYIVEVDTTDRLWDGEAWVHHDGLIHQGYKSTLEVAGVHMTSDHAVLCGAQWREARSLVHDENVLSQALATAAGTLPLPGTCSVYEAGWPRCWLLATAGARNTPSTYTTSEVVEAPDATTAQRKQPQVNATGVIRTQCQKTRTASVYLTALLRLLPGVIVQAIQGIRTTAHEVLRCARSGGLTAPHFFAMCVNCEVGITLRSTWIGGIIPEDTSRATSASAHGKKIIVTGESSHHCRRGSMNLRPVYDLANAGPKSRFTVISARGPLLVHNCKLGLGYGMGAEKFVLAAKAQAKVVLSHDEAQRIVNVYRQTHGEVVKFWRRCEEALAYIAAGREGVKVDHRGIIVTTENGLRLPNGLEIKYPDLQHGEDGWTYFDGRSRQKIYGGKVCENIIQALARILVMEQCLMVKRKQVLSVHDEGVWVVQKEEAEAAKAEIEAALRTPLPWCKDLPLNCEVGYHQSYGRAKK